MRSRILTRAAGIVAGVGLCACGPGEPAAGWIELEQIRPRARSGVFLNEPLTLHFSAPVEQASVTRESIRVRSADRGTPARGAFEVEGEQVRFLPDLPTRPDLVDAGFLPGTRYEVLVRGFPDLDGVRSSDGRPLAATYRWSFETAAESSGDHRDQLFDDRTPGWAAPLRPQSPSIRVDEAILLECDEPIDPRTLGAAGFLLRPMGTGTPIPLEVRLLSQRDARHGGERTVLELRPRSLLGPRVHLLSQERGGLRDFGGNEVLLAGERGDASMRIDVLPAGPRELHVETFLGTEGRSPVPVPGADGTASWSGSGLVTVRLPAAAGDGRAGRLELGEEPADGDLHAVSIRVPADATVKLERRGLVVLRAQGSLVIDGRLERRTEASFAGDELAPEPGETLSAWLARARELEAPWTVLVAGGDLVVRGEILVDGPLLLVAGGMLRVLSSGRVAQGAGGVHLLGDGGGPGLPPTAGRIALRIDEPETSLLREPLTFAVLSGPIPAAGGVERWLDSMVAAESRDGEFEVLFVPDDAALHEPVEGWEARAHVAALGDAPRLRILVRLTVGPPELQQAPPGVDIAPRRSPPPAWRPPLVDDVLIFFERSKAP